MKYGAAGIAIAVAATGGCRFDTTGAAGAEGAGDARGEPASPPDAAAVPGDWWDAAYDYRREVIAADVDLDQPLRDVPILVTLESDRIDYDRLRADGGDLRAVSAEGEALDVEVEHWDPAGASFLWVRLPELAAGDETRFWLYYGSSAASVADRPSDAWGSDYLAVWHLAEEVEPGGQGGVHADSTENGHDGIQRENAPVGPDSGAIGGAQEFGDGARIEIDTSDFGELGDELTIVARAQTFFPPIDFPHVLGAGGDGRFWQLWFNREAEGWRGRLRAEDAASEVFGQRGTVGVWQVLALVYDGAEVRLYVDGTLAEPGPSDLSGELDPLDTPLYLGDNPSLAPRGFTGYIDEVRIARAARSADWVRVQHLSMSDELLEFGAPESAR